MSVPDEDVDIRIAIPQRNKEKFKEVLLYILNKVGAKANVGKTVIYKLLYFIDFDFYELFEEQLMGLKYIKNKYGPTPLGFDNLIEEMEKAKELETVHSSSFSHAQQKYLPHREANLDVLTAKELKHINMVLDKHSDKTADQLSEFSHRDVPWIGTKDKQVIDYESVFYRTPETSVRNYED